MKLVAKIQRRGKSVTLTFPKGRFAFVSERIIERNIGPRPWTEAQFMRDGETVRIYVK